MSKRLPKKATTVVMAMMASCAVMGTGCAENASSAKNAGGSSAVNPIRAAAAGSPGVPRATEASSVGDPVAMVNGKPLPRDVLVKPLVEAYGLNLLLQIIQMDLARQDAAKAGVVVSPTDVRNERTIMLKGFFPDAEASDYEQLLDQLLKQQNITRPQFEILLQTNACLRKMAEPLCAGKISEENIKQAFDVMYGSTVKIRDIQVSNMQEALEVKRRAAAGEAFDALARKLSRDPRTRELGGEWPAFSRNSSGISDALKEQAFSLKDGEVSDPISTEGTFHIIKVEQHIAPRVAKLDDATRANLRSVLSEKLVQETMKSLRARTAQEAMQPNVLEIRDPELKKQFDQRVAEHAAQAKEEEDARREKELRPFVSPTTRPATAPTTLPLISPGGSPRRDVVPRHE